MIDHTGAEYGSATVLGRDEENPRLWRIRWGCCGREEVVAASKVGTCRRILPQRCIRCVRAGYSTTPRAIRNRETRKARAKPEKKGPLVVVTPNGYWVALDGDFSNSLRYSE